MKVRRPLGAQPGAEQRGGCSGQHQPPRDAHGAGVAPQRGAGAGDARYLVGAEQRRDAGLRKGGEQHRDLDQAAAADHGVDHAGEEGGGGEDEPVDGHDELKKRPGAGERRVER